MRSRSLYKVGRPLEPHPAVSYYFLPSSLCVISTPAWMQISSYLVKAFPYHSLTKAQKSTIEVFSRRLFFNAWHACSGFNTPGDRDRPGGAREKKPCRGRVACPEQVNKLATLAASVSSVSKCPFMHLSRFAVLLPSRFSAPASLNGPRLGGLILPATRISSRQSTSDTLLTTPPKHTTARSVHPHPWNHEKERPPG